MNNPNYSNAKVLTLIPLGIFAISTIILGGLTFNYFSTGSDAAAVLLIFIGSVILIITAIPCFIMSILGTVFASKAKKEGVDEAQKFFILGIIEIAIHCLGILLTIIAVIMTVIAMRRF